MDYKNIQDFMELHQGELFENDVQKLVDEAVKTPLVANNQVTEFLINDLGIDIFGYNLTDIPKGMFLGLNIEAVTIPEGVKTIGEQAFAACHNLKTVVLPSTLEELAHNAFEGCSSPALKIQIPKTLLENGILELAMIEDEDGNEIPDPDDAMNLFWKKHVKAI